MLTLGLNLMLQSEIQANPFFFFFFKFQVLLSYVAHMMEILLL